MRIFFLLIFTIIIINITGCSTQTAFVARREMSKQAFPAEGMTVLLDQMGFHERTGFYYSFEYDNQNLHLLVATSDQNLQRKMIHFGFTVWIDREGEKNQEQGFRFPLGFSMADDLQGFRLPVFGTEMIVSSLNERLVIADEIDLIGIYGTSTRTVKMRDSRIRVRAEIIDSLLIYKALIPYELLQFGYNPLLSKAPVSIGLETGHFDQSSFGRRQVPYDGRRPGNGMAPTGGMQRQSPGMMSARGRMDQGPVNMGELARPTRLWLKLEFLR